MTWMLLLGLLAQNDPVQNLQNKDPIVRRAGANVIGAMNIYSGILPLIELLKDEPNLDVRSAAIDALEKLTGKKEFHEKYADWRAWWDKEGKEKYGRPIFTTEEIRTLMEPQLQDFDRRIEKAKNEIDTSRRENRFVNVVTMAVSVLFVLVMFFFVGHVSSRIKAWKELVNKAEVYVAKSEEITKRTDQIVAELDAKKAEIMAFIAKVRDDNEGEMERYGDMLQKNIEHKMREEMMALRQKAEKEVEHTLGELRSQVDVEIRRLASDQKEKGEAAFQEQRERFIKEVEAHTLFLEASFYSIHGKPEEALRRYRRLVQLKPDHVMAWNNLGTVYRELVRYDESLDAFTKALELSPNSSSVLYNVAATHARLRKKDKMLEALARAIANDGEYKDEALNDPAFRDYWNDPAFKDIAEG